MGGRSKKYLYIIRARKNLMKKKFRKPRSPKIYSCTALKKSCKENVNEKILMQL